MTKTKTVAENVQSWTKQMVGNEQGHKLVGEQMATAWSAEDKFVGELHDYMERWCGRRHEAAQATINLRICLQMAQANLKLPKHGRD
ncbi:MAG: hypothetical protein GXP04_07100 [Alphaproteobacteria bacterium]|nr:hypothetical protein [Alphaproteobacteria bacterium]